MRILRLSFQLSQTYGINTLIYRLRSLPLLKRLITDRAYESKDIKDVLSVLVGILRFIKINIGKFLYIALFVLFPATEIPGGSALYFRHILLLGTILGMIFNTYLFEADKNKYYAIILMRMNAKQYVQVHYLWFLGKGFLFVLPPIIIFGRIVGLQLWECLLFPVLITAVKPIGGYLYLKNYERTGTPTIEGRSRVAITMMFVGTAATYVPLFFQWALPAISLPIATAVAIVLGIPSMIYLWKSRTYQSMYQKMLNLNAVIFNTIEKSTAIQNKAYTDALDAKQIVTSNKSGYGYFNELFVKRHKKILRGTAMLISIGTLVLTVAMTIGVMMNGAFKESVHRMMSNMLPYFIFIMYMTNSSPKITQAMFVNCDHSMLAYHFYRQREAILKLFKLRLAMLLKINLIPGTIIGLALPYALWISGKTDNPIDYVLMFFTIIGAVILFCVHHLSIYYIFQPYNINMKAKSSIYTIINVVTYMACYGFIMIRVPIITFAAILLGVTVVYVILALYLVNRFAPINFKLKN